MVTQPPIERMRRLALLAAVAIALVLLGTYGLRRWRAYQAREPVPPALGEDVQQQAEKFTYSRSAEGRTLFTVQASRTIERAGKTTVLEDVVAVIRGRSGDRADEVRSARCEYDVGGTGEVSCPGEVTVKLGGNPSDASASGHLLLSTSGVRFDSRRGTAATDEPVHLVFPQGTGEAVGLRYQPEQPAVRLMSAVALHIGREGREPIEVRGSQLHYYSRTQALELLPPLSLQQQDRTLVADRVRMEMDTDYRIQRLEALGSVRARALQSGRQWEMQAERAVAVYAADGNLERMKASGSVEFTREGEGAPDTLHCQEAVFHFDPSHRYVERMIATGAAQALMHAPQETRELRAPEIEYLPGAPGQSRQVLTARQRGTLVVTFSDKTQRTLVADKIEMEFREQKRLQNLAASGAVETKAVRPDGSSQATASDELRSRFDDKGDVSEAAQWGRFRYQGGDSQASAGRADYTAATDTFLLREQPAIWNSTTRTTARTIELSNKTGALRAEGDVRTAQRPTKKSDTAAGFGTGEPVYLSSERLHTEREKGWARYEGNARMWEGENRLAADSIELFRNPDKLFAEGNVSGLFFEAPQEKPEGDAEKKTEGPQESQPAKLRQAITVTSERFTYLEAERRGVFEENVKAHNAFGHLTAPHLEVFLSAGGEGSSQTVERAHARGGVYIERPDGHASSDEAEYRADTQTVVLWGGNPTAVDNRNSTTTGAELTLFLADGRILVNSGEGARAVTRRPWTR